jgi:hypothetical protein
VSTGPDDLAAAGGGHLRASHADREHVIIVLKNAFVQGRLTKDEFDHRVGQVLVSRTYAELAALTAEIPIESPTAAPPAAVPPTTVPPSTVPPAAVPPAAIAAPAAASAAAAPGALASAASPDPGPPVQPGSRTLGIAARRSGVCALITVALVEGAVLADSFALLYLAVFSFIATVAFLGYGFVDAREERRSRAQLPPAQASSHDGLNGGQPGPLPDLSSPGTRTDPTHTDANHTDPTRTHPTRTDLRARHRSPDRPLCTG